MTIENLSCFAFKTVRKVVYNRNQLNWNSYWYVATPHRLLNVEQVMAVKNVNNDKTRDFRWINTINSPVIHAAL